MSWLNGCLLPASEARIDPADRGFLLGDGVFETVRAINRRPWHLDRHLRRLADGVAALGIALPFEEPAILAGCTAVLEATLFSDAVLRLTLTRGPAPRGLLPASDTRATLLITAAPLPPAPPPARVIVATGTRRNEHSPLSRIKSLNYLDSILGRQEAAARGADDAILLNTEGRVAEASAGNVFVELEGSWLTPPVADGALPGIARGLLLEANLAQEDRLSPADLTRARCALITSSLSLRPVASIDGVRLASLPDPVAIRWHAAVHPSGGWSRG